MLNLVIFGPPGCGKGTQSARIAERYGLVHLSSGDMLRNEIEKDTTLGKQVKKYVEKGLLVPDHIILKKIYKSAIKYINSAGIIFDGFPRTLVQAVMLDRFLHKKDILLDMVILMLVDRSELYQRLMGRAEDSGRKDDNEKVFHVRMKVYEKETHCLKNYYKKQSKILQVNGMEPVGDVSDKIANAINYYCKNNRIYSKVI
ncbi:MAG: adenylate kinase [Bacteroidetes bacterium]|nr:MAG: adenylate kinase [Bacteroidota bacterium]